MRKSLLVILAVSVVFVTACTKKDSGAAAPEVKAITIKVGDNWGATHPMAAALDSVFKPQIEQASKGQIKVEVYHSGTLGNEADLWNGVRNGTIEVAIVGTPMNQEYTTMMISDWPFLYRDLKHAKAVWTASSVPAEINAEFHQKFPSVYLLAWGPNSARTYTSNKKLAGPADFRGQKFRMPGNPIHVGITEDLGASAQVIPLGELFSALETGIVDGQDNGMVTVISEAFYEVQKFVYETNHIIATLEIIASAPFLDKLTPELRKVVEDAAKATTAKAWDDYIASVDKDREFLRSKGVTVTQTTAADQTAIINSIQPTLNKLLAENAWAQSLTDKIKAIQ
jgi:tripartite ATP-independent transporter DctP family solute receptor